MCASGAWFWAVKFSYHHPFHFKFSYNIYTPLYIPEKQVELCPSHLILCYLVKVSPLSSCYHSRSSHYHSHTLHLSRAPFTPRLLLSLTVYIIKLTIISSHSLQEGLLTNSHPSVTSQQCFSGLFTIRGTASISACRKLKSSLACAGLQPNIRKDNKIKWNEVTSVQHDPTRWGGSAHPTLG